MNRRIGPEIVPLIGLVAVAILFFPAIGKADLTAPPTSTGVYTVSWTESSGLQRSAYLYETINGGPWIKYNVTGAKSKTFAKPQGVYSYKLELCFYESELGQELCEPFSNEITVVVITGDVPGVAATLGNDETSNTGSFGLSWDAASGTVTRYELEERVGSAGSWIVIHSGSELTVSLTRDDGSYYYRVHACNDAGCGGFTNIKKVTVLKIPGIPGSLGLDETRGPFYVIRWDGSSGAVERYELLEQSNGGAWKVVHNSGSPFKEFRYKPEGVYLYKVRACNRSGCSDFTSAKQVTVQLPQNISGPTVSSGIYTLSWGQSLDTPEFQERKSGSNWRTVYKGRSTSIAFYKLCEDCEGVFQYRLRFCIPPEPDFEGFCLPWGAIHTVTVDHPLNFVLRTETCPICTQKQIEDWQHITNFSGGVAGRDPAGERIGPAAAYRWGLGMNWYPVDVFKQTFCGEAYRFMVYDPWGDEADFNHFIIPNPAYIHILDDVKVIADPDDVWDCVGTDDCVEVEITPDENFFSNPWFYKDPGAWGGGRSMLVGRPICTYGPWVWEEVHGNRPEIHPAELYWWRLLNQYRSDKGHYSVFYLMLLQDDSNRFDRKENFNVVDPPPAWWRPWSAYPRMAEFKIGFELIPSEQPPIYEIMEDEPWKRHVITATFPRVLWDADDGKEHAIEYNGSVVLIARELQQRDDDIGVRFLDVCRDAANTRLQGYITIKSMVGTGDRGSEGYHVIRVERREDVPDGGAVGGPDAPTSTRRPNLEPPRHFEPPRPEGGEPEVPRQVQPVIRAEVSKQSLRRVVSEARPRLVIDVDVEIAGDSDIPRKRLTVSRVHHIAGDRRKEFRFTRGTQANRLRVVKVPVALVEPAKLQLTMRSGDVLSLPLPQISLAPRITAERPQHYAMATSAWGAVVEAAGGLAVATTPLAQVQKVGQWKVEVAPAYAAVRAGAVSLEDESPVAEELNDVLRHGDVLRLRELFGSAQPFTVEWSFAATNLTTGASVPVKVGQVAGEGEVRVEFLPSEVPQGKIKIWFPEQPANNIYELAATAKITDTFGATGEIQHRVWSHVLTAETEEELVEAAMLSVAAEAGIAANEFVAASRLDVQPDDEQARDPQFRRARMLRLMAMRAAEDLRITLGELRGLIRGAKLFQQR